MLGGKYYIDLERYVEFIADIKPNERLTNSAITETYGESMEGEEGEMNLMSKEIVETKGTGGGNEFFHNIRFTLIGNLVDSLTKGYTAEGELCDIRDSEDLTMEQKFAFNTLTKYGILVKEE
jgi:hypothetical protein